MKMKKKKGMIEETEEEVIVTERPGGSLRLRLRQPPGRNRKKSKSKPSAAGEGRTKKKTAAKKSSAKGQGTRKTGSEQRRAESDAAAPRAQITAEEQIRGGRCMRVLACSVRRFFCRSSGMCAGPGHAVRGSLGFMGR